MHSQNAESNVDKEINRWINSFEYPLIMVTMPTNSLGANNAHGVKDSMCASM